MPANNDQKGSFGKRLRRWLAPRVAVLLIVVGAGYYVKANIDDLLAAAGDKPKPSASPSVSPKPAPLLPLEPPPAKACVRKYCGKQLAYASIIVDTGRRRTTLPRRAWEISVTTALTASGLRDLGNEAVPDSLNYPYDALSNNADAVGLFQLTPQWGKLSERMDPRFAAQKFYAKLKGVVAKREGWEDRRRVSTRELAQATHGSIYEARYQGYEADAIAIVDFVLKYTFKQRNSVGDTFNDVRYDKDSGIVMFQCADPYSLKCEAIVYRMIQPVIDNREARKRWFPRMEYMGDLGDKRHQDNNPPQDHTPGADSVSCIFDKCNIRGWVYAQDFGDQGDFNLPVFVRWLLIELRKGRYDCVKYVISTHAVNLKVENFEEYYGFFGRKDNWVHRDRKADHPTHVHISYMPGCERMHQNILLDYHNWQLTL